MLENDTIKLRKEEIEEARLKMVDQIQRLEDQLDASRTRLANMNGALELLGIFERDAVSYDRQQEELKKRQAEAATE